MFVALVPRTVPARYRRRANPLASLLSLGVAGCATMLLASAVTTLVPREALSMRSTEAVAAPVLLDAIVIVAER